MEYDFTLKFRLSAANATVDQLVERLGQAGCDDAVVGSGIAGRLALNFTRKASSADEAVINALRDVRSAIPDAQLIEAAPDYVSLSDVADMVGVSRQNLRKLMTAHADFPAPIHSGSNSQVQLWHLEAVLHWLHAHANYKISSQLMDVARVAMQCNLLREASKVEPAIQRRLAALVA